METGFSVKNPPGKRQKTTETKFLLHQNKVEELFTNNNEVGDRERTKVN